MRHTEYVNLFRTMAAEHKKILHHPDTNPAFFRIIDSADNPLVAKIYLEEFITAQRNIDADRIVILANYSTFYQGETGNWPKKNMSGALFILKRCANDEFDAQSNALDETEEIGEQMLSRLETTLTGDDECSLFRQPDGIGAEKMGPAGNDWYGSAFYFTITKQHEDLFDDSVATDTDIWNFPEEETEEPEEEDPEEPEED
jgi:hypothetical protein